MHQLLDKLSLKPFYQCGLAISITFIIAVIVKLLINLNTFEDPGVIYWEFAFSILLCYMLLNSIFSLLSEERVIYFRDSIFAFMLTALICGVIAYFFSGLSFDEAGSFRWLYILFTFVYLVFLTIVNLMRKVMDYAQRQDGRLRGEE